MSKSGPLIIIDDDKEEHFFYKTVLNSLNLRNKLIFFENGKEALEYLETTTDSPFLILCDMNMPVMNGLELRKKIAESPELKRKSTPFIFRTGTATTKDLIRSYELTVQGFFKKTDDLHQLEHQLAMIINYWKECLDPGSNI